MSIPYIDERVEYKEYKGVSYLRKINASDLRLLKTLIVLHDNFDPVAVLLPYAMFMALQAEILAAQREQAAEGRGK